MKSERRHELEKNELADWLADFIKKVKPYQNLALIVMIVIALAIGGYSLSVWLEAGKTAKGWDRFYQALTEEHPNPAVFDQIRKQYPNTSLAEWSAAIAGDLYLSDGCGNLFLNKANANEALRQASDRYRDLLGQCRQPLLKARATFGLARTFESQGDLKKAIERYEEVVKDWPNGTYTAKASERLQDLQNPTVVAWYDKFEEFDPKEAFASEPGVPGQRLPFDSNTLLEPTSLEPLISPQLDLRPREKPEGGLELKMPSLDPGAEDEDEPASTPATKDDPDKTPAKTPSAEKAEKDEPSPPDATGEKKDDATPISDKKLPDPDDGVLDEKEIE